MLGGTLFDDLADSIGVKEERDCVDGGRKAKSVEVK